MHVSQIIMLYPLKLYSVYVKDLLTKLEEREREKKKSIAFLVFWLLLLRC